jgi:DNA-binding transcriptional regulator LsrR (DeoR family)
MYKKTGSSNFTLPMKRHELADYLNISRPALSKELVLMRNEGIIEFNRSSISILNIKLLEKYYLGNIDKIDKPMVF